MEDKHLFLAHYGVSVDKGAPGRGSGRYPKGSGERPFQRDKPKFEEWVREHKGGTQTDDVRIAKGTSVQNISVNGKRQIEPGKKMYVSYDPIDKLRYAGDYAQFMKNFRNNYGTKVYRNELQTTQDLLSPGRERRKEEFYGLYRDDTNNIARYMAAQEIDRSKILRLINKLPIDLTSRQAKHYMNLGQKELEKLYPTFTTYFGDRKDDKLSYGTDAYIARLKKAGYNSMIDDMDVGDYARSPLIVFDPDKSLSYVKGKPLTNKEMRENSRNYLKENSKAIEELWEEYRKLYPEEKSK